MSMEKIALWPSSSQKGRKQYKRNLHYAKQRNALKMSPYCSAYGHILFIHPIAMNMVGVEETLELESSAKNKLCPISPQECIFHPSDSLIQKALFCSEKKI